MTAVTVPRRLQDLVDHSVARFGENLQGLLWHGSRARGEGTPPSDDDLMFLFARIDDAVLLAARDLFAGAGRDGFSTSLMSPAELRHLPPNKRFRLAHGVVALHGAFAPVPATREDALAYLRGSLREVLARSRDRLLNQSPSPATAYRVAKFAVFAMKARELYDHGRYPLTRDELLATTDGAEERRIIDWVARWQDVAPEVERDPLPALLHLDRFARGALMALPGGEGIPVGDLIAARPLAPAEPPRRVVELAAVCVARLGDGLRAVLWHGGAVADEPPLLCDEDVTLVLRRVDDAALLALRAALLALGEPRPSVFVASDDELRQSPHDRRLRFAAGYRVVHGAFQPLPLPRACLLGELRQQLRDVSFQCRDRLVHGKPPARVMRISARRAVAAMRARHLLDRGELLESLDDVAATVGGDDRTIVDWLRRWPELQPRFAAGPAPVLLHLDAFARRRIDALPLA